MKIVNDFEGANPSSPAAVEQLGDAHFAVHPWSEDGDGNYKFHLNVKVLNERPEPQDARVDIVWGGDEYMADRDYVLLGRGPSWQHIQAQVDDDTIRALVTVPPGEWYLGLSPVFDLDMAAAEREKAVAAGLEHRVYGRSYYGRDLHALAAGAKGAPTVLIVSRFHPYETAASYLADGILDLLAEDLAAGGPLTGSFRFVVVPMPNPDGVALGCCKRFRQGAPDGHQGYGTPDPAGQALTRLLQETAPRGYLDLHGWMWRERDWFIYSDERAFAAFRPTLQGPEFDKDLRLDHMHEPAEAKPNDYRVQAHSPGALGPGAFALCPSISFFYRQPAQMRQIGRTILTGFCRALALSAK